MGGVGPRYVIRNEIDRLCGLHYKHEHIVSDKKTILI